MRLLSLNSGLLRMSARTSSSLQPSSRMRARYWRNPAASGSRSRSSRYERRTIASASPGDIRRPTDGRRSSDVERTRIDEIVSFHPSRRRSLTSKPKRLEFPWNRTSRKTIASARPKILIDEILSFISRGTALTSSPAPTQKYSPLKSRSSKKQTPSRGRSPCPHRCACRGAAASRSAMAPRAVAVNRIVTSVVAAIHDDSRPATRQAGSRARRGRGTRRRRRASYLNGAESDESDVHREPDGPHRGPGRSHLQHHPRLPSRPSQHPAEAVQQPARGSRRHRRGHADPVRRDGARADAALRGGRHRARAGTRAGRKERRADRVGDDVRRGSRRHRTGGERDDPDGPVVTPRPGGTRRALHDREGAAVDLCRRVAEAERARDRVSRTAGYCAVAVFAEAVPLSSSFIS